MKIAYHFCLYLVRRLLPIVGLFNQKIRLMCRGQKETFSKLSKLNKERPLIWVHVSSLGEFEQGLPLMERFLKAHPNYQLLVSFFSPSGHAVQCENPIADCVVYLPMDSPKNAKNFIDWAQPKIAVFVKYEFWYRYLKQLKKKNIPTILIAGIFRKEQWFFKNYGKFGVAMLQCFDYLFLQDETSKKLLQTIGIVNTQVTGDPRFERVLKIRETSIAQEDWLRNFKRDDKLLVMGSTWREEEQQFLQMASQVINMGYKVLLAPHQIDKERLQALQNNLESQGLSCQRYTENKPIDKGLKVFILDTYGMLSKVYAYATVAYVGGGHTKDGVHNVLEPAVFGMPIIIGPNYQKFKEARDLVALGGCLVTRDAITFSAVLRDCCDRATRQRIGQINSDFVNRHQGATDLVLKYLAQNYTF